MIVNVCPASIARVPPERVWRLVSLPERYGDWVDAEVVAVQPAGRAAAGQRIELTTPFLGRRWPFTSEVMGVDPGQRWIDLRVRLPFGVTNDEHLTLSEVDGGGGTLIRFN
jgi:hypothetical protein